MKKWGYILMALAIAVIGIESQSIKADAQEKYEKQVVQFVNTGDSTNMSVNDNNSNSQISSGAENDGWELVYFGDGYYQIKNSVTGFAITPENGKAEDGAQLIDNSAPTGAAQFWRLINLRSDNNSLDWIYKIVNLENENLVITIENNTAILKTYENKPEQHFLMNSYGAEGFAGRSSDMNGEYTASVYGGVKGQTVYVTTLEDLVKYAQGNTPYTIVIAANIGANDLTKVVVGENKTFVGSYNYHTLRNIHFRCGDKTVSGNCIFRNITFVHDSDKNENDDIQMYIGGGYKYWIDHCTWVGHEQLLDTDVDKHLYVGGKADFVSVTSCKFMNHKYGLILGWPGDADADLNDYSGFPHMTLADNYFSGVVTRAPGLMRYGYFHSYNNYVYDFDIGYTPYTGVNIYSENNYFEKGNHGGFVVNEMGRGLFTDVGSVLSSDISNLSIGQTSWRPNANYAYTAMNAENAKKWVTNYAGAQNSYLTYPNK